MTVVIAWALITSSVGYSLWNGHRTMTRGFQEVLGAQPAKRRRWGR